MSGNDKSGIAEKRQAAKTSSASKVKTVRAFPLRRFMTVMMVTVVVLIFAGVRVWTNHVEMETSTARALTLQTLSKDIVYLDEALTMSARMAAATGHARWEERYREFEPRLDEAINKLVEMIPEAYESQDTAAVDAANKKLVELENKSFDFVRQGQRENGLELLSSPEYEQNKKIYAGDMKRVAAVIARAINKGHKAFDRATKLTAMLTGSAILTLMLAWPTILVQMKRHISERKQTERELRELVKGIEGQDWHKTGQAELNDKMRGEQTTADLARNVITKLAKYLDAQIGAIYLAGNDDNLKMAGSYAYTTRKDVSNEFKFGQGLVGQAAMEKSTIVVTDVPKDYVPIQSGVGKSVARNILVMPLVYEGTVCGVIELGSFRKFSGTELEFLEKVAENIAVAINSAQSRAKVGELLEETQRQSEELQNQQAELRATNAELEQQTESLKRSEETLKVQQEELEAANSDLEDKTATLEEQKDDLEKSWTQIKAKSKELELSNKYKSEFLSNMSHELRTPLNSLLILAKMLADNGEGNLTDEQVESAKVIHEGGTELLSLINEILDLSKVEAGKMEINIEDMSIAELLGSLEKDFARTAQKKDIELKTHLAEGLPAGISSDEKRVKQILKNLLSNAFKFTEKGCVTIEIGRAASGTTFSRSSLKRDAAIAFSVSDTGLGISKEKQQMIFEAFQQADGTIDRRYGGTGLGLSISKELSKLLGGEIHLQSKQGEGSTFTLYLPETSKGSGKVEGPSAYESAMNSDREMCAATSHEITTTYQSTGAEIVPDDRDIVTEDDRAILIIEDDPKFARILMGISHEKGFKCLVAGDGETGLKFAAEKKPNAIILDIGLPGMDGFSVIDALKDNPVTRHIPVHFISGQDELRSETKALSMGAIGYLTKPVDKQQLDETFNTIEEFISRDIKKLLIAEDDPDTRESIVKLVRSDDIEITAVGTGREAYDLLKSQKFDCMVLDLGLPDMSGFDLLSQMKEDESISTKPPVVIYSGRELSREEATELKEYAGSVILKGAESPERLLDETSLFLHRVESSLPQEQQRMIRMVHDRDSILEGKKVLVVDDDVRNVFALSHALKAQRMKVIRAENGRQALELLEANPDVDAVLMDIMMPVMDGYEAITKIREQKKHWKLPILALTAKAMKGDRDKCIEVGANDYLAKPIDIEKVLSMLRVWLYM